MIRAEIKKLIQKAVKSHWNIDLELDKIKIDYPPEGFGDYSTSVAIMLAKEAKSNLMETAEEIADEILKIKHGAIEHAKVVKPGFINFYLKKDFLQNTVKEINKAGEEYGDLDIGKGKKLQIEFISANPTGPLTLGNGRGGFYGDVLANILQKTEFDVEQEYYINDVGEQVRKLGHSIIGDEQAVYKGEYIEKIKKSLLASLRGRSGPAPLFQKEEKNAEEIGKQAAEKIIEEMIKPTAENKMKIKFDKWFRESELYKKSEVEKILEYLKEKNLAYEKEGALWFKSTEFGDDKDRVLIKADGEKTYLASDIAYLKNKFKRGFSKLIHIWGADHHGYIKRFKAAAEALGYDSNKIDIIIIQLVRLFENGKEVRMSKRAGTYVTIDELLDEIPLDVARFFFLMRSPDSHLNFDLNLAKERSEKNPVYYVQYAHARICSIFKRSDPSDSNLHPNDPNISKLLEHESELKLIKQLIKFPEIVEDIVKDYQVHRLPNYVLDLVRDFHKFYETCRVIDEKAPELTQARLALVRAVQIVLKNILDLMGISAPERM